MIQSYTYKLLPLLDCPTQNIQEHFKESNNFIQATLDENSTNKILIHCFAGKSRATTMTCAFLMENKGMTLRDAFYLVKEKRPIAQPNVGFVFQLKAFEKELFGQNSELHINPENPTPEMEGKTPEEVSHLKEVADSKEILKD